jgi:hypothetical protein
MRRDWSFGFLSLLLAAMETRATLHCHWIFDDVNKPRVVTLRAKRHRRSFQGEITCMLTSSLKESFPVGFVIVQAGVAIPYQRYPVQDLPRPPFQRDSIDT